MIRSPRALVLAVTAVLALAGGAEAATWKVDPAHTSVSFRVRHLFTKMQGRFTKFDGTIEYDAKKPKETKVQGSIDAASIDTDNEKRDQHLRGEDFFHVEKFPKITFESGEVTDVDADAGTAKMKGSLTMHGVTKPIELAVEALGQGKDPNGKTKGGFRATTKINRKDFGIEWNKTLDAGGMVLGDEIDIEIDVEAVSE